MKNLLFFFILCGLFSCNKQNDAIEYACFTLVERQCATDPYNTYVKNATTLEEKARSIQAYLKDQGISGTVLVPNPIYTGAVCQSCICPNGVSYQLTLSASDTTKLKSLSLSLVNKSCE
ncbi:MAG: hypothetical protein ABI761_07355 [Saprospiraceae bacterium]